MGWGWGGGLQGRRVPAVDRAWPEPLLPALRARPARRGGRGFLASQVLARRRPPSPSLRPGLDARLGRASSRSPTAARPPYFFSYQPLFLLLSASISPSISLYFPFHQLLFPLPSASISPSVSLSRDACLTRSAAALRPFVCPSASVLLPRPPTHRPACSSRVHVLKRPVYVARFLHISSPVAASTRPLVDLLAPLAGRGQRGRRAARADGAGGRAGRAGPLRKASRLPPTAGDVPRQMRAVLFLRFGSNALRPGLSARRVGVIPD